MRDQKKLLLCSSVLFLFLSQTWAEEPANLSIPVSHPPLPSHSICGVNFSSYIAASYNYLSQSQLFTSGIPARLYDQKENGFTLQQAGLSFEKEPDQGMGGLLYAIIGNDATVSAAYGFNPAFQNAPSLAVDLIQAYLQYNDKAHQFTIMGGEMSSLVGYEYTFPQYDPIFSSSYLATFLEPTTVTGLRGNYSVTDHIKLSLGVNNGWDNIRDRSRRKTIEFGGVYADKKYLFSVYIYNGEERETPYTSVGSLGIRTLYDVVGTIQVTDKLKLTANYDYVIQNRALLSTNLLGQAIAQGIATYVEYQFNDKWRGCVRSEYFIDETGTPTGISQNIKEMTLTLSYLILKNVELRAETRRDISNVSSFLTKNRLSSRNNLQSFALEGVMTL